MGEYLALAGKPMTFGVYFCFCIDEPRCTFILHSPYPRGQYALGLDTVYSALLDFKIKAGKK